MVVSSFFFLNINNAYPHCFFTVLIVTSEPWRYVLFSVNRVRFFHDTEQVRVMLGQLEVKSMGNRDPE